MSQQDQTLPEIDPVEEELVAYLDEELEPDHRARVEHRLADDPRYRDKLRHMQKSWDMLDLLARSEPDEAFARTTVAMVALKAKDAVQEQKQSTQRVGFLFRLGVATGTLACALISYGIGSWILSAPDRQLVQDLPLIERLDAYSHAESVEFLLLLDKHGLFLPGDEEEAAAVPAVPEVDTDARRRARLENMTPTQKEAVYEKQQQFTALSLEEQQSLRQLQAEIEAFGQRERLLQVMNNYQDWLKSAPSKDEAEVLSTPVKTRVAKIKEVQVRLAWERLKMVASELSEPDIQAISLWLELYVANHETELAASTPQRFRASLDRLPPHERIRRHVAGIIWRLETLPVPTEQEFATLHSVVSETAQAVLDEAETHEQKWQYAREFIRQVQISKVYPRLSDEELRKFAETLTPEQRGTMETMTAEEMKRAWRDMYYRQKASPPGGLFPWDNFGPPRDPGK